MKKDNSYKMTKEGQKSTHKKDKKTDWTMADLLCELLAPPPVQRLLTAVTRVRSVPLPPGGRVSGRLLLLLLLLLLLSSFCSSSFCSSSRVPFPTTNNSISDKIFLLPLMSYFLHPDFIPPPPHLASALSAPPPKRMSWSWLVFL